MFEQGSPNFSRDGPDWTRPLSKTKQEAGENNWRRVSFLALISNKFLCLTSWEFQQLPEGIHVSKIGTFYNEQGKKIFQYCAL